MKYMTIVDLELRNRLREEIDTLKEYQAMLGTMTTEKKEELRQWIAGGNSVNSNPYWLYGENGRLMDLIAASRIHEDMGNNPELYMLRPKEQAEDLDDDIPF